MRWLSFGFPHVRYTESDNELRRFLVVASGTTSFAVGLAVHVDVATCSEAQLRPREASVESRSRQGGCG